MDDSLINAARAASEQAQNTPETYPIGTLAWVIGLSIWGGVASFCHKLRNGHARPFNLAEFFGEIVISGFAGMLTFFLCEASNVPQLVTAALVGISGHMGSRAIFLIERWAMKKWGGA